MAATLGCDYDRPERAAASGDAMLRIDREGRLAVDGRHLTNDELEELARQRSVRPLSAQECQQYVYTQLSRVPEMPYGALPRFASCRSHGSPGSVRRGTRFSLNI